MRGLLCAYLAGFLFLPVLALLVWLLAAGARTALPLAWEIRIHSGATGALIRAFGRRQVGFRADSVVAGPDLDGDGVAEIAAGLPAERAPQGVGRVAVFSGATGERLVEIQHPRPGGRPSPGFGESVRFVSDLDRDGKADLAVPIDRDESKSKGDAEEVPEPGAMLFSSATGARLTEAEALLRPSEKLRLGGDFDGDGVPDLIDVRRDEGSREEDGQACRRDAFVVRLLSGASAETIREIDAGPTSPLSDALPAGDVDGDGRADVVLPRFDSCRFALYSGAAGAPLGEADAAEAEPDACGSDMRFLRFAPLGDLDGDGAAELGILVENVSVSAGASSFRLLSYSRRRARFESWFSPGAPGGLRVCCFWSAGDRDGAPDVIVPTWTGTTWWRSRAVLRTVSGRTGAESASELLSSRWSMAVGSAGDVDRDGVPDVLAVAAAGGLAGAAEAFVDLVDRLAPPAEGAP